MMERYKGRKLTPDWLKIDPWVATPRPNQVYEAIGRRLMLGDFPTQLSMNAVRTALTRLEREKLLKDVNSALGVQHGFVARWTGDRRGHIALRLKWNSS